MTSYGNTTTIETGPAVRDHVRVRPLLAALVLALAIALGAAAAIGVTTLQLAEVAPSYQGDWKDAFLPAVVGPVARP